MGAITRGVANGITTNGVVLKSIINNDSMDNVTAFPSGIPADSITFISSQTASSSASISFTTGITSTYKAYKFVFVNIHPSASTGSFQFNLSTDSGSNYNVTKTSTFFHPYHDESGTDFALEYATSSDLAQSTLDQRLFQGGLDNDNDSNASGSLILFNPSSTTYVKHFIGTTNGVLDVGGANYTRCGFVAGYGNTTSAINAIIFKMSTGNIDAGTIYLYGIK